MLAARSLLAPSHAVAAVAVTLLACALATPAVGRLQGAKGRRLTVHSTPAAYRGGVLVLGPTAIESSFDHASSSRGAELVTKEGLRRLTDQFLHTRLRELPWRVRVELPHHPLALEEGVPTLRAIPRLTYQEAGQQVLLAVDFIDAHERDLVASYTGYGWGRMPNKWRSAHDDLQEISRVLVDQLASAMGERAPRHRGGYDSRPYLRRPVDLSPPRTRRAESRRESAGPTVSTAAPPAEEPTVRAPRLMSRRAATPLDKDTATP